MKIIKFLSVLSLALLASGCMSGLYWATSSDIQAEYENEAHRYWSQKNTPYLIKHFKKRAAYHGSDSFFFAKPVKYRIDYSVIKDILEQRLEDKGVFECFWEVANNPRKYRSIGAIYSIGKYYSVGKDVTPYLLELYKNPALYVYSSGRNKDWPLKGAIVRFLLDNKIKVPELVPFIKKEIERKRTSTSLPYHKSMYNNETQYLKFLGEN